LPDEAKSKRYISIGITYGPDAMRGPNLYLTDYWGWHMIGLLFGIQERCLDGDAAKLMMELVDAIQSDRPVPKQLDKAKNEKIEVIEGTVQEIDEKTIKLSGGERAMLNDKTEYGRETGDDLTPSKRSELKKGMEVYMGVREQEGQRVAVYVFIKFPQLQPKEPAGQTGTTKRFEALAAELPIFQTHEFAAGRTGLDGLAMRFAPRKLTDSWLEASRALTAGKDDVAGLIPLLKHKDPKVRTLALAALFDRQDPKLLLHLAGLVGDKAKTAPQVVIRRAVAAFGKDDELLPQDIDEQTVGQVAKEFLTRWLAPAGYKVEQFDAYWAERKDRSWCASWFLTRFERASQNTTAFDPKRGTPLIRAIRKDIDALPEVDRDWALLWVGTHHGSISDEPARILATPDDLIAAGKRLGPKRLMELIQEKEISKDPDMAPRPATEPRQTRGRDDVILWVLKNAGKLLRPEDAPAVLVMEDQLRDPTPWCAIAAAELQPENARKWLRAAMGRFAGKEIYTHLAYDRADIAVAIWRIIGDGETDYLVDWFFNEKGTENVEPPQTGKFVTEIQGVRSPADRKLVARIVTDARFDKIGYTSVRSVVRVVNRWTKTPVTPPRDLYPNWESGTLRPQTAGDMQVIAGWRSKLRDSVKEWHTAK
jgi:hypothetical protein